MALQTDPEAKPTEIHLPEPMASTDQAPMSSDDRPPAAALKEQANWADLPGDILSLIFTKIGAIDILMRAQSVCRSWRRLSFDPLLWRTISMTTPPADQFTTIDMDPLARDAVNRSQGHLEEFSADHFGSDDLLTYIADRAGRLTRLRLIAADGITDQGLARSLSRFPLLEELEIVFGSFTDEICRLAGKSCPNLKFFRFNSQGCRYVQFESDVEAVGIADSMPELRGLQLVGNKLTNRGLAAILDKCRHLEALDLRRCFNVSFSESIRAKCIGIRDLRLPDDPMDGYAFTAEVAGDGFFGDDQCCYPGEFVMEMIYDDLFFDYEDSDFLY